MLYTINAVIYNFNSFDYHFTTNHLTYEVSWLLSTFSSFIDLSYLTHIMSILIVKLYSFNKFFFWIYSLLIWKVFFVNVLLYIFWKFLLNPILSNKHKMVLKYCFFNIFNQIKNFLNLDVFIQAHWYFIIFITFIFYNLYSLLPKTNNIITILVVPLFFANWIFLTQVFMSIIVSKELWLCNFYPAKLSILLAPMIILIEILSFSVRPFSLSLRIFANMLAGHILAHIISFYGVALLTNGFFVVSFFIFLLLVILTFMEFFVSIVQPLIFLALSSIYLEESLSCCVN